MTVETHNALMAQLAHALGKEATIWEKARCATPAAAGVDFFPGRGQSSQPAKEVCAKCRVREECLEFALENVIQHGVWGGLTERQRRPLRAARGKHNAS